MSLQHDEFLVRVLLVICQNLAAKPDTSFTRDDLVQWCTGVANLRVTTITLALLVTMGYLKKPDGQPRPVAGSRALYAFAPAGIVAAQQAVLEGKKQAQRKKRLEREAKFAKRVWDLLRIRRQMTAQGAAETLVDVGHDTGKTQARAAACLRAWSKARPDSVQVSKLLVEGQKRYVLVKDLGLVPPQKPTKPAAKKARVSA